MKLQIYSTADAQRVRQGLLEHEIVLEDFGGDVAGFAEVLPRYREELARQNLVDYDEQILTAQTHEHVIFTVRGALLR